MKIKILTGFRDEQYYIIESEEAHKAYYLFNNPETRTIFENGVALIGRNIQGIEPAWNENMGWNATHRLDGYDWNEIRKSGLENKIRIILEDAKKVAQLAERNIELLKLPLNEAKNKLLN